MSFEYPQDLKYLDTHEYVRLDGEIGTIGITEFAVDQMGDVVFLELPEIGDKITKGETFGTIESVKAVEDLNSPVTGTVIERNESLIESPDIFLFTSVDNILLLSIFYYYYYFSEKCYESSIV